MIATYHAQGVISVHVKMVRELAYVAAGLLLLAYVVDFLFSLGDDPREPPRVSSKIPLIGHVVGLMRHGPTYYRRTRSGGPPEKR